VRAVSLKLPKDAGWVDEGASHVKARLGEGFGYEL
jgi:hypothetical protein